MVEILPEPFDDRVMKKVLAPPHIPMPHELLFPVPWSTKLESSKRSSNKRREIVQE